MKSVSVLDQVYYPAGDSSQHSSSQLHISASSSNGEEGDVFVGQKKKEAAVLTDESSSDDSSDEDASEFWSLRVGSPDKLASAILLRHSLANRTAPAPPGGSVATGLGSSHTMTSSFPPAQRAATSCPPQRDSCSSYPRCSNASYPRSRNPSSPRPGMSICTLHNMLAPISPLA